jgi:hypothetical protein
MAHIYLTFDFASDEEKAQQARHKLDGWKQAFRLDKKLLYKFDRGDGADTEEQAETPAKKEKAAKGAKSKEAASKKEKAAETATAASHTKLYLRLAFSNHEKLTEQRWVGRIPAEEPFREASPATIRQGDAGFEEVESHFEDLD